MKNPFPRKNENKKENLNARILLLNNKKKKNIIVEWEGRMGGKVMERNIEFYLKNKNKIY